MKINTTSFDVINYISFLILKEKAVQEQSSVAFSSTFQDTIQTLLPKAFCACSPTKLILSSILQFQHPMSIQSWLVIPSDQWWPLNGRQYILEILEIIYHYTNTSIPCYYIQSSTTSNTSTRTSTRTSNFNSHKINKKNGISMSKNRHLSFTLNATPT